MSCLDLDFIFDSFVRLEIITKEYNNYFNLDIDIDEDFEVYEDEDIIYIEIEMLKNLKQI